MFSSTSDGGDRAGPRRAICAGPVFPEIHLRTGRARTRSTQVPPAAGKSHRAAISQPHKGKSPLVPKRHRSDACLGLQPLPAGAGEAVCSHTTGACRPLANRNVWHSLSEGVLSSLLQRLCSRAWPAGSKVTESDLTVYRTAPVRKQGMPSSSSRGWGEDGFFLLGERGRLPGRGSL